MKKIAFPFSRILSILLACGLLTGCGVGVQPSRPDTPTPVEEISDRETSFSHAEDNIPYGENSSDAAKREAEKRKERENFTFSSVPYYEDDTGKSIQRDGNFLYIYYFGDLLRYNKTTGSSTLLYETGRYHDVHFCLYGDYIYFLDRTTANSLDGKNTELYRIDKDGKNLTLLKEDILNIEYQNEYNVRRHYGEGETYQIDIYNDTIYLLNTVWDEETQDVTGNLYFRILEDGSIKEIKQSETLYGRLPKGFHVCSRYGILSLPYAMRNYGYLFVEDNSGNFCRLEPESRKSEILIPASYDWQDTCFSRNSILFKGTVDNEEEKTLLLLSLDNAAATPLPAADASLTDYATSLSDYVPLEDGFICYDYYYKTDKVVFSVYQISSEGKNTKLLSDFSLPELPGLNEENSYNFSLFDDMQLGENCLYYSVDAGAEKQLRRFLLSGSQENIPLHTRFVYDTADIPGFITDSTKEEIPIGDYYTCNYELETILLEEKTDAERLINQTLSGVYKEFEANSAQNAEEEAEYYNTDIEDPDNDEAEHYTGFSDFSLSAYCDYLDKDYIAFGLSYYTYFSGAAHGYYYTDYYLFERKTGKLLTIRDLEGGDDDELIQTMRPYVEVAAEWQSPFEDEYFPPDVLLDEKRLSLSEDGYTLYFAPYELGCYASGSFLIIIPFDAFENNL